MRIFRLAVFRRHLPVAQHEIAQPVDAAEQMRAVAFTGAVHVQDIAAAYLHIVFERFMALTVGQHQVNNKTFAQETDLILGDGDIPGRQLGADLWFGATADKQCPADIFNHVKSEFAALWCQGA